MERTKLSVRILLVGAGTAGGLAIAEFGARIITGTESFEAHVVSENRRHTKPLSGNAYAIDPVLGFVPRLGEGVYGPHGTRRNKYSDEKPEGVQRVLFVGDSVTARGRIVDAIDRVYGDDSSHEGRFEWWNAGVESFTTTQELAFYKAFNHEIEPDHVILTLHPNDFRSTPVVFEHAPGELTLYSPRRPQRQGNAWLYRNSVLYRTVFMKLMADKPIGWSTFRLEVKESLREFRDLLTRDDIRFTVLVLPTLLPWSEWKNQHRRARDAMLEIGDELGFEYYDLLEPAWTALSRGLEIQQRPGDSTHPSTDAAAYIGDWLASQGFVPGADGTIGSKARIPHPVPAD